MRTEQRYSVDSVEVTLVKDETGAHWECSRCATRCEHVLRAAAWITLESWTKTADAKPH